MTRANAETIGEERSMRHIMAIGLTSVLSSDIVPVMTDNKNSWGWGFRSGHGFGAWKGQGPPKGFSGFVAGFAPHHGGQGRFFEAGEARLAILSLLEDGPKHGYEIMKELETRSGGLYRA